MQFQEREKLNLEIQMERTPGYTGAWAKVWRRLRAWENAKTGYTQPSQATIARDCSLSRKTVNLAVKGLRQHGFIKTQQRYVLHRDRTLYGTLRYWVAKELGQVEWILKKQLAELRDKLWTGKSRVAYPAAPKPYKAPTQAEKDAVYRYWLEQLGCNIDVATPSSSLLNPDNLMSPTHKKPPDGG